MMVGHHTFLTMQQSTAESESVINVSVRDDSVTDKVGLCRYETYHSHRRQ